MILPVGADRSPCGCQSFSLWVSIRVELRQSPYRCQSFSLLVPIILPVGVFQGGAKAVSFYSHGRDLFMDRVVDNLNNG